MPKREAFISVPNYYATLFHEIGHSLMPTEQRKSKSPFGSQDYAKEELVAELFASLCLQSCNLLEGVVFQNSASYLANWLKALKDDPSLIIKASREALKRYKTLVGDSEGEGEPSEEQGVSEEGED